MSAFIVSKAHIDGLIVAGLLLPGRLGRMRWYWPAVDPTEDPGVWAEGEPWGPDCVRLMQSRRHELTEETAGQVGAMLWNENQRSVNHRYEEEEFEPAYDPTEAIRCRWLRPDPVVVLKAVDCFEYQSCEHPGWMSSEAYAYCRSLRAVAIRALPGMDDAPGWELGSLAELAGKVAVNKDA